MVELAYKRTQYDGKETSFYFKESLLAEPLKKLENQPSYDEVYLEYPKSK